MAVGGEGEILAGVRCAGSRSNGDLGLLTTNGGEAPLIQWQKQAYLTTDELRERLAVKTGAVVARALVLAMSEQHPELFTDTAKPRDVM
jgi:hypothetical protein